jgi:hypothetical protein
MLGAGKTGAARACTKNGKECDPKKPRQCCSGTCKKHGKRHRCKPTPGAEGCAIRDDFCAGKAVSCPGNDNGSCVVLDSGKPFCFRSTACVDCDTDADCDAAFTATGGICVTRCPVCVPLGTRSLCVFPLVEEAVAAPARRLAAGSA